MDGEYCGEVGDLVGASASDRPALVGLYCGDVGEYCGDVGEYCGDVGEYCGDVGEYAGDRTSLWPPGEYWGAAKARREGTSQIQSERAGVGMLSEEGLQVGE